MNLVVGAHASVIFAAGSVWGKWANPRFSIEGGYLKGRGLDVDAGVAMQVALSLVRGKFRNA